MDYDVAILFINDAVWKRILQYALPFSGKICREKEKERERRKEGEIEECLSWIEAEKREREISLRKPSDQVLVISVGA